MRKFDTFEELIKKIDTNKAYSEEELRQFLGCQGSDVVENENDKPTCGFSLESENKVYTIGVTSIEVDSETGDFKNFYWIMD